VGIRVYNGSAADGRNTLGPQIVQVDMTVHQVCRLELSDKPVEAFKAAVARVFHVVNMAGGSMRQKYVHIAAVSDFVHDE